MEGTFQTFDMLRLFYRFYPHERSRGTLVILHGHGEHSGRYEKFQQHLAGQSLNLALFDFRGHGRSEGRQVYINRYEDFIQDVTTFLDFLKHKHQVEGPIILLGHSNGGLVAVHWAFQNTGRVKALILSSPFLGIDLHPFLIGLNRLIHRLNPKFIYGNPIYPPYLTHNLEEVANYKADPMIRRKISARLLSEMLKFIGKAHELDVSKTPFPVHVLAAGTERVVDLKKTMGFIERVNAPQKSIKVFDDFYHEIFNELEQEKAFAELNRILSDILA